MSSRGLNMKLDELSTATRSAAVFLNHARTKTLEITSRFFSILRRHGGAAYSVPQTNLLDLPAEILIGVFEELNSEDRKNLASVHDRLNKIEKISGCREFDRILFASNLIHSNTGNEVRCTVISSELNAAAKDFAVFLNRAITWILEITGELSRETARNLLIALKTVEFQTLIVDFTSENNGRFINELLRDRKCDEVWIQFGEEKDERDPLDNGKEVLMGLKQMEICFIRNYKEAVTITIDDDIFLHLLSVSNPTYFEGAISITANGLAKAFKMFCCSKKNKDAKFLFPKFLLDEYLLQFDLNEVYHFHGLMRHFESMATIWYTQDERDERLYIVSMCR